MSPSLRTPLLVLAFAALTAVGAQIDVPMRPVPMTMQSFAVLLSGAVLGSVRGAAAVLFYLGLALLGLPVLAEGAGGAEPFLGPTAGYLFAFPLAAAGAGLAARRGVLSHWGGGAAALFGLHLLLLGVGGAWLALEIGAADAWTVGVEPFLVGAAVKSLLVLAAWRLWPSWLRGG
ncbi:biotin transporter BioY [Brevundimonas balnearis]|uniref:Biotin transporter n=1 Tax=Brevundimonas balnearis TaxID=1572858 RepID=A0ABV6R4G7_9CAUL